MRNTAAVTALIMATVAVRAHGAITITKLDGSEADAAEATKTLNPLTGGWDIVLMALYAPAGETRYTITADGGEVIDNLLIDVPCWQDPDGVCIPAGSPLYIEVLGAAPGWLRTVHNIEQVGDAETAILKVEVTEDVGSVTADDIGWIAAGRDVVGPIVATTEDNAHRGVFWVEAQRDILGDVTAEHGRVAMVWAHRDVGTPSQPVFVGAKHEVRVVAAWTDVYSYEGTAYVNVNSRMNGGDGGMYIFVAHAFFGSLDIGAVEHDAFTGTPGRLKFLQEMNGVVRIGRSFVDPEQWIALPPGGLHGQIIINADGGPNADWTAPIYLGSADAPEGQIVGPHYADTADSIGGGSIGLVPFNLHANSCDPPHTAAVPSDPAGNVVTIRHYGPVAIEGAAPLIIERREIGSAGPYVTRPLSDFDITIDAADPNSVRVQSASPGGGFVSGYEYRIHATNDLRSDATGQPPVEWSSAYLFAVEAADDCPADFSGSGEVGLVDLLWLLSFWGPCANCDADLDHDGNVGFGDLLTVLVGWGPCPE